MRGENKRAGRFQLCRRWLLPRVPDMLMTGNIQARCVLLPTGGGPEVPCENLRFWPYRMGKRSKGMSESEASHE